MAHLTPQPTHCQQPLDVQPQPLSFTESPDIYHNQRSFFEIASPHDSLFVRASRLAREAARDAFSTTWAPSGIRRLRSSTSPTTCTPAKPLSTPPDPRITPGCPLIGAACAPMQRVHQDFTYASRSTEISTPAVEVLRLRRGVCQDFAHVMLALGRDYADISSIRGVIHNGAGHRLEVGVTVEPFDTATLAEAPAPPLQPAD